MLKQKLYTTKRIWFTIGRCFGYVLHSQLQGKLANDTGCDFGVQYTLYTATFIQIHVVLGICLLCLSVDIFLKSECLYA